VSSAVDVVRAPSARGDAPAFLLYAAGALVLAAGAAALAGWAPIQFSIATVLLFAGPHNWIELRYFLSRLPARLGKSRTFFVTAFAGIALLTVLRATLPIAEFAWGWSATGWSAATAAWDSLFVLWIALLVYLRGRQSSRRDWSIAFPVAFAILAAVWLAPEYFDLALVYAHPLVALWLLDRELRRQPERRKAYRMALAGLPVIVAALWWRLAGSPSPAGDDILTLRITQHAGAEILPSVSSHLLVATHTFLEMVHYGVWLVAIPFAARLGAPWQAAAIPLVRRQGGWPRAIRAALGASAFAVIVLWVAFLGDYTATRDVYFTLALVHVLAEIPFVLRTL
jgi:hypothetical protein